MIGLGRLLLATLHLVAVWADPSQLARSPIPAHWVVAGYAALALVTVAMIWDDWALDAKLAGPAHTIDIAFFTLVVLMNTGLTSPYLTFFMFVLLAAAIRWGWRATALSSVLLILLYLVATLLVARSTGQADFEGIALRTGDLAILSLILIWFGASRWGLGGRSRHRGMLGHPSLDESPIESGLRAMMDGLRASAGAMLWRGPGQSFAGVLIRDGERSEIAEPAAVLARGAGTSPFLYDFGHDRSLTKDPERNLIERRAADMLDPGAAARLGLSGGLAVPVSAGPGEGVMFLEGIRGLSSDHIDLGTQLAADLAAYVQAHALLKAADENAEARSRLTLARDLHDGIVQFLAGAAFRLEAMRRAQSSGRDLAPALDDLKQLLMQEQHELRTFITVLRAGPAGEFSQLAVDLKALADRLARQWGIRCAFEADEADRPVPARLQLDAHQLIREAVANAVRHAEATSVSISLAVAGDDLHLSVSNNGLAPRAPGGEIQIPWSIKERVDSAAGSLDIARGQTMTRVAITLPLASRPR